MNRQQRRAVSKDHERIDVSGIVVHFANGQYVNLDIKKVQVIDKETGRPLFDQVLEPIGAYNLKDNPDGTVSVDDPTKPAGFARTPYQEFKDEPDKQSYTVEFDTPEGKMIYVKEGNWSGVKPA